jgi:phage baseplate assembly protein W
MATEPIPSPRPVPLTDGVGGGPQDHEFLGRGWRFPPALDLKGVAMSAYEQKIAESIRIVLGTSKGERVMRPEFGCGIHDLVFEPAAESTLTLIRAAVREALILWEPRVELLDVRIEAAPGHRLRISPSGDRTGSLPPAAIRDGALIIGIDYRIRSTNNEFNLVYPFFLKQGA